MWDMSTSYLYGFCDDRIYTFIATEAHKIAGKDDVGFGGEPEYPLKGIDQ